MGNLSKALAAFQGLADGDPALATVYLDADRYVEHDPHGQDGIAGVRRSADMLAAGEHHRRVVRTLEDGECVVIQSDGRLREGGTFFDVFRFEQGLVVEHWAFAAPSGPPNRSGHTQVDGPTAARADADADRSKALVREYYETVHLSGRHEKVRQFLSSEIQIRHEPGVADGVDAFELDLAMLTQDRTIDEIKLLLAQGDLVFLVALGTHRGDPCAYIDLYRVQSGRLVEHWGFPQPILPLGSRANSNGMI